MSDLFQTKHIRHLWLHSANTALMWVLSADHMCLQLCVCRMQSQMSDVFGFKQIRHQWKYFFFKRKKNFFFQRWFRLESPGLYEGETGSDRVWWMNGYPAVTERNGRLWSDVSRTLMCGIRWFWPAFWIDEKNIFFVFVFCVFWCGIVLTMATGEVVRQGKDFD